MSELMVPEGWEVVKIGNISELINGRAYKLSEWENTGIPVIRLQNLTQNTYICLQRFLLFYKS